MDIGFQWIDNAITWPLLIGNEKDTKTMANTNEKTKTKTNQFAVDGLRNHFDPLLIGYSAHECHPSTHLLQTAGIYLTIFFSMEPTSQEASLAGN